MAKDIAVSWWDSDASYVQVEKGQPERVSDAHTHTRQGASAQITRGQHITRTSLKQILALNYRLLHKWTLQMFHFYPIRSVIDEYIPITTFRMM